MKTSDFVVIIPCYNEAESIEAVVMGAKKYADICVINDCSTDSTPQILAEIENIHVVHHEKNTHIARGILDGMQYAMNAGYEYAITMDAGLSHDPDDIPLFLGTEAADLVLGKRGRKTNTPLFRRALSALGGLVYNVFLDFPWMFSRPYYSDLTTGYRRYSRSAMEVLLSSSMNSRSFDFIYESAMIICRSKLKIAEIPISYHFSNSSLNIRVVIDCIKIIFDRPLHNFLRREP